MVPEPAAGEVLVRVTAVGLCGSDRHWYEHAAIGDTPLTTPIVLGHEIAGAIVGGPRDGERVAIDPSQPCERCETCLGGRPDLCPTTRFAGYAETDGGLQTWLPWPSDLCLTVPDQVTDDEAAVLEAVGVSLHAVDLAAVAPGDRVAVVGAGPIGQLVIRALRARGVTDVVASEPLEHRRTAALAAGASSVWDPADLDAEARHQGVTVVIECAGAAGAIDAAIRLVEPGGRIVLVGIPGDDRVAFRASGARRKGLTLVYARRMTASDLPAALEAVATGAIDVRSMISDRFALADVQVAFERLASGAANKIVVRPAATD